MGFTGARLVLKALFDTNILIDYLKGVESAQTELDRHRQRLRLTGLQGAAIVDQIERRGSAID